LRRTQSFPPGKHQKFALVGREGIQSMDVERLDLKSELGRHFRYGIGGRENEKSPSALILHIDQRWIVALRLLHKAR